MTPHVQAPSLPVEITSGNVRVQVLSNSLVRLEQKGPEGFEDRETFVVAARPRQIDRETAASDWSLDTDTFRVTVPKNAKDLSSVKLQDKSGRSLYQFRGKMPENKFFPNPGDKISSFVIADSPRVVPSAVGATPNGDDPTSGWDLKNNAPDIYVFVPGQGGYATLRKDFLDLTGHTELPPLFTFGFWDSRYHPYSQPEATVVIDKYREKGIPLDLFVVDTDWRVNGSHGYTVETKLFPDMQGFIDDAHSKHVRLMFNDHPEPVVKGALDPKELQYRSDNLSKLLNMGVDVWWYDRNWMTHLHEPAPGIAAEVWGQRLYHDITQRARPDQRPLIMTNVQGIDNGLRHYPPSPASHRYPIWWTGDTTAVWTYLQRGIANGVDAGVNSLLPYVNEDLGGHIGTPTPELYVRYLQYGCLSPVTRIHCTRGEIRYPWAFGPEAEAIVTDYIKMRYRLTPTIYSAARRSYDDGTPVLRRCDLEWPNEREAKGDMQYLLGDDLLIAPVSESVEGDAKVIPSNYLHTDSGAEGLDAEYFSNQFLKAPSSAHKIDRQVAFNWDNKTPLPKMPKENFSIRWSGKLGPIPATGTYSLATRSDDGVRLYLDGKLIIDDWKGQPETEMRASVELEQGRTYAITLEYMQLGGDASCYLEWVKPEQIRTVVNRRLWIPPGEWENLWTGETVVGPRTISVDVPLRQTPMYARKSGIVFLAPDMQYTSEKPWDPVTIEAFVPSRDGTVTRDLYEDDGISNDYKTGGRRTQVTLTRLGSTVKVAIGAAKGTFKGAPDSRQWIVRLHMPKGAFVKSTDEQQIFLSSKDPVTIPLSGGASGNRGGIVDQLQLASSPVTVAREVSVEITSR